GCSTSNRVSRMASEHSSDRICLLFVLEKYPSLKSRYSVLKTVSSLVPISFSPNSRMRKLSSRRLTLDLYNRFLIDSLVERKAPAISSTLKPHNNLSAIKNELLQHNKITSATTSYNVMGMGV